MTQGPAGHSCTRLRQRMAAEGRCLPRLGSDDRTASQNYIREFVLVGNRECGCRYGVEFAEPFSCSGPPRDRGSEYVDAKAVPL